MDLLESKSIVFNRLYFLVCAHYIVATMDTGLQLIPISQATVYNSKSHAVF